jgi:tetratricopeptide (TPR) repeat protein
MSERGLTLALPHFVFDLIRPTMRANLDDLPELQEARALWGQGRVSAALDAFAAAARRHPRHARALADAARSHGGAHRMREALGWARALAKLARNHPVIAELAGQTYQIIGRHDLAVSLLQQAARGGRVNALLALAVHSERAHYLDRALRQLDRLESLAPGHPAGAFLRARIDRRQGRAAPALAAFRRIFSDTSLPEVLRAEAGTEAAAALDAQGLRDEACEEAARAKALLRPEAEAIAKQSDGESRRLASLVEGFDPDALAAWREEAPPDSPEAPRVTLLAGCPRSGTTLLGRMLESLSGTVLADEFDILPKWVQPVLFEGVASDADGAEALAQIRPEALAAARRLYLDLHRARFGKPLGGLLLIDKNPSITGLIPAFLRLFPHARVLMPLRDPRDIALSCFLRHFPVNTVSRDFLTLPEAARRTAAELRLWIGLRQRLPADAWCEVRYENLVTRPEATLRPVCEALGIEWSAAALDFHRRRPVRPVTSPSYEGVAQPLFTTSVGRWRPCAAHFGDSLGELEAVGREIGCLA